MSPTPQPRSAELRAALELAGSLADCREPGRLAELFGLLPSLIEADSVLVTDCHDWAADVRCEVGDPGVYRPELLEAVAVNWHEHPVFSRDLAGPARGARVISDFLDSRTWRRRALYNDFYRPLGMSRELTGQLSWGPGGASCCVVLHRAGREFSGRERVMLELLAPHLRAARRRVGIEARPGPITEGGDGGRTGDDAPPSAMLARQLPLTPRQAEVLCHLAAGQTNDGIAHRLGISPHTVVRHVEHLYARLGVHTRVGAATIALEVLREDA
jgi:DNA-binding CsgD family transcriptional regulator